MISNLGFYMIYTILLPIIAGLICLIIPRIKEIISILASLATLVLTILLFMRRPLHSNLFLLDNLSSFILLAIAFFGVIIVIYSLKSMSGHNRLREYYTYILWTIGASCGAALANNLILLLIFWGFLGFTLYMLIGIGGPDAAYAAKKTFIIVGGTDALMIMGIGIIWLLTNSFTINALSLPLNSPLTILAFILIVCACLAKAGAIPFHTWIPDSAEPAPLPVMAFLPASLDKLLGIYLLARVSLYIFRVIPNSAMSILLMVIGSVTIVAAVMMALIQHNAKKLLSFHAVSQVGYMVLGIGTGIPIGIAGGLFHMLNHTIYKCCLFLTIGNVASRTGTSELNKLGGLARAMPATFGAFLIAALAISGIPPLNGFVSKWMVYQGIIELGGRGGTLWPLWLVAAMAGSALTLASFMKLTYSVYLGPKKWEGKPQLKEVGWTMWLPVVILAGLCIVFGIFAYQIPLRYFIVPVEKGIRYIGIWQPELATVLVIIGIIVGLIIYWLGSAMKTRTAAAPFYGGEVLPQSARVTGTDFYNTIKDIGILKYLYKKASEKKFDIYEQGVRGVLYVNGLLRRLHNGILPTYLAWCLLGMIIMFIFLIR